ncbi:MAG: GNAT family N-acetyltransferase [Candidatus Omnitrophica bacterium]|nr:GNAT family N-acetyltransferase [Candidatus Omnitrophota bacterium]
MQTKLTRILAFLLCFLLIFEQSGFAQVAGQLDIAGSLSLLRNTLIPDVYRPLHLRYLSFDSLNNNFNILVDKGSLKDHSNQELEDSGKILLDYFLIGLTLPNESFWVNLRPDAEDDIIDDNLAQTEIGKIMLASDVELKKDTARFTSPQTPEGKEYWDKLYKKAGELFGSEEVTIPTLTRPWIIPDEIIIRETKDSAYIYKATLKVCLEQDYLKNSATYNFKDDRLKELNEYASQLIRDLIIPKLTKEINTSKRYAQLRQVYYSLIMAQWFKSRFSSQNNPYSKLIDRNVITSNLASKESWSKSTYFEAYQKSFKDGEYNIKDSVNTLYGQVIRSYFSGGISGIAPNMPPFGAETFTDPKTGARITLSPSNGTISEIFRKGKKFLFPLLVLLSLTEASGAAQPEFKVKVLEEPPKITALAAIPASKPAPSINKKELFAKDLINLGIKAQNDPAALRQVFQLIPKLEQIIRSKTTNKEQERIRYIALDLLFRLVKYPDTFAFKYESSPVVHAFERLFSALVKLEEEGVTVEDLGRLPYSHLEWFAENGYVFAINALVDTYKSTSKDSVLWRRSALALHNLLYNYPHQREKLVGLLTPDISLQKQVVNILSKNESRGAKEFIKQHPDFGYLILYHLRNDRKFIDSIRQDKSMPVELRAYALGLTCLLLDQNLTEINKIIKGEDWQYLAEKFFRESGSNKIQNILREDLVLAGEPKLQSYFLMFAILMNSEPLLPKESGETTMLLKAASSFRLNAYIEGAYSVGVMGLNRIGYSYQTFWSFAHEAMHKLLYSKGFNQTLTNQNMAAMHEFLCDIYGFKSLRSIIGDNNLFNDAVKRITANSKYEKHSANWENKPNDKSIEDTHTPGRAALARIIRSNPQGVNWDRIFRISVEVLNELRSDFQQDEVPYSTFNRFATEIESRYNKGKNDLRGGQTKAVIGLKVTPTNKNEDHALEGDVTREDVEAIQRLADSSGARRIALPKDIVKELEDKFGPGRINGAEVIVVAEPFMKRLDGRSINGPVRLGNRIFIGDQYLAGHNNDLRLILAGLGHEAMAKWVAEMHSEISPEDAHELARQMEDILRVEQKEDVARKKTGNVWPVRGNELYIRQIASYLAMVNKETEKKSYEKLQEAFGNPNNEYLVYLENGEVAGFITCVKEVYGDRVYLSVFDILVFSRFRDKGIGRGLWSAAREYAQKIGAQKIVVKAILPQAKGFWDRIFEEERKNGTPLAYLGLGAIVEVYLSRDLWEEEAGRDDRRAIEGIFWSVNNSRTFDELYELARKGEVELEKTKLGSNLVDILIIAQACPLDIVGQQAELILERLSSNSKKIVLKEAKRILNSSDWYSDKEKDGSKRVVSLLSQKSKIIESPELERNVVPEAKLIQATKSFGGIDFRHLPIVTQAISSLSVNIGNPSASRLNDINLNSEWREIENLVNSGIVPSSDRIKEYLQASCYKGNIDRDIDKVISCIADILRMEEERCCATDSGLKDILVVIDSAVSEQDLRVALLGKRI